MIELAEANSNIPRQRYGCTKYWDFRALNNGVWSQRKASRQNEEWIHLGGESLLLKVLRI